MAPTTAKTLMKDFRASFRKKKSVDPTPIIDKAKELEDEELAKLTELKDNAAGTIPSKYTDADLLAFLRARSLNVKEAEKLMQVDHNLRLFLQLDDFLKNSDAPELTLTKQFTCSGTIGYDKEGSLIRVLNPGCSDFKGFVQCVSTIENFKLFLWYIEKDIQLQKQENKRSGRNAVQLTYIINCENIPISKVMYKPTLDTGILAVKLLQDHYHDTVKVAFLINAPPLFSTVFKFFKPVIREALHKKIRIYEGVGWQEELLKRIDADVLPVYLGGNRVDCNDDPTCKAILGCGGEIPNELYPSKRLDPNDPDVTRVTVPAGSSINYRLPIKEIGSMARWHIQAVDNDIGIGVFLDASEIVEDAAGKKKRRDEDLSGMEQLTPVIRSQCHVCPEVGHTVSWFTGTVIVHLDNSYSWMMSKDVLFKITVEPPNGTSHKHPPSEYKCANK